jgi:2-amino-4-hydroxy-6-hydroxymethyldihydropteridine diphosphokinase
VGAPRAPLVPLVTIALGLGGNLGDVEAALGAALAGLAAGLGPLRVADLYRSRPWAPPGATAPASAPPYLNTAALADTDLPPEAVLGLAKALELAAGRRRGPRYGPRPLDIDLLLWGGRTSEAPELTLPHPRLRERRFVLAPLAELAPGMRVPPDGATVADLLARVGQEDEVERIGWGGGGGGGRGNG